MNWIDLWARARWERELQAWNTTIRVLPPLILRPIGYYKAGKQAQIRPSQLVWWVVLGTIAQLEATVRRWWG